jgi:hypothetical protein
MIASFLDEAANLSSIDLVMQHENEAASETRRRPTSRRTVRAGTLGQAWIQSLRSVLASGQWTEDEGVPLLELLGLSVHISHPSLADRLIDSVADRNVLRRTEAKFSRTPDLPDAPFTYGERLYNLNGFDQIEWLCQRLSRHRLSKSATVCLLVPNERERHLPCLTTLDAKIRNGALHLQFFFRSQNILGRQYANLVALAGLQSEIAARCKAGIGSLAGYIASAHIYDFDIEDARKLTSGLRFRLVDRYRDLGPQAGRTTSHFMQRETVAR